MDRARPPGWDDVVCATSRRVSSPACDEVLILGLDPALYRDPDRIGARVLRLVREPVRVSEIHRLLVEETGMDPETARRELLDVLAQLGSVALVETRRGGEP